MARCEDCIYRKMCYWIALFGEETPCEHFLSTADVAPKSEVEYLKEHLEMWCEKHKNAREKIQTLEAKIEQYQIDLHYSVCREDEARERVATEIFDELEYLSVDGTISINSGYYAELKNKYTGEQK